MEVSTTAAANALLKEAIVAVPTETVYGLAGLYNSDFACEKIFRIKKRERSKRLSVLISSVAEMNLLVDDLHDGAAELMQAFWPGPLTLILPAGKHFACMGTSVEKTIGIRMPDHPKTLEIIAKTGPLACPSANPSGLAPPTDPLMVKNYFGSGLAIVNGGVCKEKVASTVIVFEGERWKIVREGTLSPQALADVLGYLPEFKQEINLSHATTDSSSLAGLCCK